MMIKIGFVREHLTASAIATKPSTAPKIPAQPVWFEMNGQMEAARTKLVHATMKLTGAPRHALEKAPENAGLLAAAWGGVCIVPET